MIKKYWVLYFILILIIVLGGCSSDEGVKNYTLSVGVQTEGTGSVEIEPEKDSYQEGEEATLTATAEEGYRFDHWEGSGYDGETDNPLTVKMMSDLTLVAVFVEEDNTAPEWLTDPYITTPFETDSVGISAAIDEDGTIYHKVLSDGEIAPSAAEVKEADNSTQITADTETEITIDGLDSNIEYDIYFAAEDSEGNLQEDSAVKQVDLNTADENESPVIDSISNITDGQAEITEGEELLLDVTASDADGDTLTYNISGADAEKFTQSANIFSWTPPYDDYSSNNTFNITLEVSDGTETVTSDVMITVNDDTTAPTTPTVEGITEGTYNTDQSFTVSGESGATIEYSLNNGANWNSYSGEVTISEEGSYEIVARQTDEAGNVSEESSVIAVTIDKTAPEWVTDPYISTTADTNSVGVSTAINEDGTVYYKVLLDGEATPSAAEVKEADNSTQITADTATEITIDGLDSDNDYEIYFVAEDSEGNLQEDNAVKQVDVSMGTDNTAPVIESISNVTDGQAEITEGEELLLEVTASDADGDSLTYSISGADAEKFTQSANIFSWTPPYDDYSSNNTFNITLEVSDGTETVTSDVMITVNDDTTAPSAPTVEGITEGTYNTDQSFTVSGESGATIEYSLDDGANWNSYSAEVTISAEGSYEIVARQTDGADNLSEESSVIAVTIDKTVPEWKVDPYISTPAGTDNVGISASINEDGKIYYQVLLDGAAAPTSGDIKRAGNSTIVTANLEKEIAVSTLSPGVSYDIFFIAEDSSGNLQDDSVVKKVDVSIIAVPTTVSVPAGTTTADNGSLSLGYNIEIGQYEISNRQFISFLNDAGVAADGFYQGEEMIDLASGYCQIGHDGSDFYLKGWADYPVIEVTWYGAVAYCNWLSEYQGLTPAYSFDTWQLTGDPENLEGYRLPTETEWEYAARGGSEGLPTTFAGSDDIHEVAWYDGNSGAEGNSNLMHGQGTMPVGQKAPNELGIYDMSGNVYEWTDPLNASSPSEYKYYGGCWWAAYEYNSVDYASSRNEDSWNFYGLGFRPVRTAN